MPTATMSAPATAGPTTRALFITTPLRLTAPARSAGGTSEPTNACRAGESTIPTTPPATVIATTSGIPAWPVSAAPHNPRASRA